MRRILCVYLPNLALERLTATWVRRPVSKARPAPSDERADAAAPAAVVLPVSGGLRITRVNEAARRRGVRPGQTSAEATALAPGLAVHAEDGAEDRRALERLAAWADCLSPVVAIAGEDCLQVDVTGCARVFGGEEPLGRRAVEGLAGLGFTTWVALADTPGAAWALSHAGERIDWGDRLTICSPGHTAAALARLPVWALRVEPAAADGLRRVGVETIEALLHLPRSAVAKRFGEGVLRRLDQALGDAPELLDPFQTPPVVCARVGFVDATDRWEHVRAAVVRAVEQVCAALDKRVAGIRRLHITFHLSRDPRVIEVGETVRTGRIQDCTEVMELSRATRDARKLTHLVGVRLEGMTLPAAVEGISVWSRALEGLDGVQRTWFDTQAEDAAAFGDLLDRMALRLGRWGVVQPQLVEDHAPERAYAYVPAAVTRTSGPPTAGYLPFRRKGPRAETANADIRLSQEHSDGGGIAAPALSCRPLRLHEPVGIEVLALLPDGPVLRFRQGGQDHAVSCWAGPERVETGWWRGRGVRRDYYRVEDDAGRRYWIFKDLTAGGWYVQGVFD